MTHRRCWLKARLLKLATVFSIKLAAFAIMENHFHVVLKVERGQAEKWSDTEIIQRWHQVFKGTELSQRFLAQEALSIEEQKILSHSIGRWRLALTDISWFMRCVKEPLARQANKEDGCKGRFWEGRFHSQALLDARALVACMTYVDLNPLRANLGKFPESDPFTSLHQRAAAVAPDNAAPQALHSGLMHIDAHAEHTASITLPFNTLEYLELVDIAARHDRPDKKGTLNTHAQPVLERLGISKSAWQDLEICFKKHFHVLVGCSDSLKNACRILGQKGAWGQQHCQSFFDESQVASQ
ncbi:transposase [Granulosicoccus sp. 3-233]|uniref:transposase n=1 Tax=Granulosicoccus sp. 3-233 TaxID=3417969 RepID=UPI003D3482B4